MSTNNLKGRYFVKKDGDADFQDITTLFDGVKVLSIGGYNEKGKAVNVYTAQWLTEASQQEDYLVTTLNNLNEPVVLRENVNLTVTFIVGNKYATSAIDVQTQHDAFVDYMLSSDLYLKSGYTDKQVRCVCLDAYKPTMEKLHRGLNSYILGTITFHTLDAPTSNESPVTLGNLYIGFGANILSSMSDITSLMNVQHFNQADNAGNYSIACPTLSYLWLCTDGTVGNVTANGFEVPMNDFITVGTYRCYRTTNDIKPHTMNFTIS